MLKNKNSIWLWVNYNPIKVIVILSLLIHLLIGVLYQHITIYPDSEGYINLATRFLNLNLYNYEGERSPGYPLLLSACNLSTLAVILIQQMMGVFTLIVVFKTFLLVGINKQLALVVTLFISCYLPIIFFEYAILTETLTFLVITLIFYFYFLIKKNGERKLAHIIKLGLLCFYLVLIKPFYIFLPFVLLLCLFSKEDSTKKTLIIFAFTILLPLSAFLGWSYVNKINTGQFVSTTFYGFNLAQNCVNFAEKTPPEYAEIGTIYAKYRENRISDKETAMVIWEAYPELQQKTNLSFPDLSKKLYDYSIATIKKNPTDYLTQVFVSWRDFWKTSFYWEKESCKIEKAENPILYISYIERGMMQLIKLLFVLLIPYNVIVAIRRKNISPQFVISAVVLSASILQAMVTYGTNSRFSYPFEVLIVTSVILNIVEYRRNKSSFF